MRDLTTPSIAVVIAARDAENFIAETLESLVLQSSPPSEVIVYDDGSRDATMEVAKGYRGRLPGLQVLRGEQSLGISAARNRANAVSSSDYLAVLDADDIFPRHTIHRYENFLAEHPETDLLYADTVVCDEELIRGRERRYPEFATPRDAIRRTLGSPLVPFKHSSMVFRRKALEALGGYDEGLRLKVDFELFLRFLADGRNVAKYNAVASLHRKHQRQVSVDRIGGLGIYQRLIKSYEPNLLVRGFLYSTRFSSEILKLLLKG